MHLAALVIPTLALAVAALPTGPSRAAESLSAEEKRAAMALGGIATASSMDYVGTAAEAKRDAEPFMLGGIATASSMDMVGRLDGREPMLLGGIATAKSMDYVQRVEKRA